AVGGLLLRLRPDARLPEDEEEQEGQDEQAKGEQRPRREAGDQLQLVAVEPEDERGRHQSRDRVRRPVEEVGGLAPARRRDEEVVGIEEAVVHDARPESSVVSPRFAEPRTRLFLTAVLARLVGWVESSRPTGSKRAAGGSRRLDPPYERTPPLSEA